MSPNDLTLGTAIESQTKGHRAPGTKESAEVSQTATVRVGAHLGGHSPLSHDEAGRC